MKRLCLLLVIINIFTYTCLAVEPKKQDAPILLMYNKNIIVTDVPPLIVSDRCLVPARAFFEGVGATVAWVSDIGRVDIALANQKISLTIGKNLAYVDGTVVSMDVPATIIDGRTMIPVRFISESFGMKVTWKDSPRTVEITDNSVSGVLKDLRSSVDDDNLNVEIKFSVAPSRYAVYYLYDPYRLVVDIYGVKSVDKDFSTKFSPPGVKTLRVGIHDDFVRLVFDTESELPYNIVQGKSKTDMSVYIALPSGSPSPTTPAPPTGTPFVKTGMLVAIDAGHGGSDPGASAMFDDNNIFEKDLNLDIALKLKELLEAKGIQVYMTRSTDKAVDLYSRPDLCTASKADIMISIHNNAIASPEINGIMTFYAPPPSDIEPYPITSKRLAEIVQKEITGTATANDMGAREAGDYIVLKYSRIPAVIVEVGFLTNQDEIKKLNDSTYRLLLAQGLCDAASKALDEIYAEKPSN